MPYPEFPVSPLELTPEQRQMSATIGSVRREASRAVERAVTAMDVRKWCLQSAMSLYSKEFDDPETLRALAQVIYEFVTADVEQEKTRLEEAG